jgi:hypothetical protein
VKWYFMAPQLANLVLGLWTTASPSVFRYGPPASHSEHIVGPLVASFACIALWEATRSVRWVNLPLGLWLTAAPWLLGVPVAGCVSGTATGIAIAGAACLGGGVRRQFGGGWAALWRRNELRTR